MGFNIANGASGYSLICECAFIAVKISVNTKQTETEGIIMPRKGENIYKRKDGRWEGRYIRSRDLSNKARYGYVYGNNYKTVKQELINKRLLCRQPIVEETTSNSLYCDLLDRWLSSSKLKIKESTCARYSHLIRTHIKPCLGEYAINEITAHKIENFMLQQLTEGRLDHAGGLSFKTVADMLVIIKSTMEYAQYEDITVSCDLSKLTVKKQEKEMRVLTIDEQKLLVNVLTKDMDRSKFGVLLALYTGIRIGELCALQWEDICLSQSTLKIKKTMQRIQVTDGVALTKTKIIITEPKSKCSVRNIPLPAFLIEMVNKFATVPQAFILSGEANRYVEPRTMQNRFKSYVAESGIKNANFHALRHTFATRCVEVGFEIKSLSEILGHANVNITLNRYVHSSFELKHINMNKLTLPL